MSRAVHRVLWIAPQLPSRDRDGGGKRMVEMIHALCSHGSEVHVWARDAGDVERDGPVLRAMGAIPHGTTLAVRDAWQPGAQSDDLLSLLARQNWDTIVVSFARLAALVTHPIRRLCPGVPMLIDNADLHYLRRSRMEGATRWRTGKRSELRAYAASDGVIVASDVESEILARELPSTPTISFTVGPGRPRRGPHLERRRGPLFVGALTHPPNEDAVRWWIDDIGPRVNATVGHASPLTVVGTGTEVLAMEGGRSTDLVRLSGWAPSLAEAFDRSRVFAAPLRFGAGTKSKILDGLTNGVPIVTTRIGIEGFPSHIRDACEVEDDAVAFSKAVAALLVDDDRWHRRRADAIAAAHQAWADHQQAADSLVRWIRERRPIRKRHRGLHTN